LVVNSETEAGQCYPNTNRDTEQMRWWEFAGTAHTGLSDPAELGLLVELGACSVSFAPAWRGAVHVMQRWFAGDEPRHQPRLLPSGSPPVFERDSHGNAVGGIRLPEMEAPLATHVGQSPPTGLLNMIGSGTPFSDDEIRHLYDARQDWFGRYRAALDALVQADVYLPDDASEVLARAEALDIAALDRENRQ
jgi:hypothetical protein